MTEPPNPFSREGSAEPSRPRPSSDRPGAAGSGEDWPVYPSAPHAFGHDRGDLGAYGGAQPAADPYRSGYPASPYESAPAVGYGPDTAGPTPYGAHIGGLQYPANPYGPNPYAGPYGYTPTNHPQAVVSLVLGVIGLVVCSFVGIAALLVGRTARKEILAQPLRYSGLGMATAGWVMGIVGTVLSVLITLFVMLGLSGALDG